MAFWQFSKFLQIFFIYNFSWVLRGFLGNYLWKTVKIRSFFHFQYVGERNVGTPGSCSISQNTGKTLKLYFLLVIFSSFSVILKCSHCFCWWLSSRLMEKNFPIEMWVFHQYITKIVSKWKHTYTYKYTNTAIY